MNLYMTALATHMLGALGFFVALGLEWFSLRRLRRAATGEQFRNRLRFFSGVRVVGMVSMLALIFSGLYMVITAWGQAWFAFVTLGTLILLFIPMAVLTGARVEAIKQVVGEKDGPLSSDLLPLWQHPLLRVSMRLRVALGAAILYLMNTKPGLGDAMLAIGVAALIGLVSSMPFTRSERIQGEPAK